MNRHTTRIALLALFTLCLCGLPTLATAGDIPCNGCTLSVVSAPDFRNVEMRFIIPSADGPIEYITVDQVLPNPQYLWMVCACADDDGYRGEHEEPQHRWCQQLDEYYYEPDPGTGWCETDHCAWKFGYPVEDGCVKRYFYNTCPDK